jgi:hypothetical protein
MGLTVQSEPFALATPEEQVPVVADAHDAMVDA